MIARGPLHPGPERSNALGTAGSCEKGNTHDTHTKEQWNEGVGNEGVVHDVTYLANYDVTQI